MEVMVRRLLGESDWVLDPFEVFSGFGLRIEGINEYFWEAAAWGGKFHWDCQNGSIGSFEGYLKFRYLNALVGNDKMLPTLPGFSDKFVFDFINLDFFNFINLDFLRINCLSYQALF